MGNALAIAAVTAVLKDLLNNGLIDHNITGAVGGNVTVSALPPDRVFAPGARRQSTQSLSVSGGAQRGMAECWAAVP
jgi:hypothetical protein